MIRLSNWIDGRDAEPESGEHFESPCPATGEAHALIPDSQADDVDRAVKAARKAFPGWRDTPLEKRAAVLNRIADILESRLEEFAQAESADQGKPVWLAREVDIPRAIKNFRFFASSILHHVDETTDIDGLAFNYARREPLGVAGLISPWNLPLYLLTWKVAPAIACGNTCVAKPSEFTSVTAWMMREVFHEAGLPPGVVNLVFGKGLPAGQALTKHPDVPLISFTGGTRTAEDIITSSASHFKKLGLELGGKNPNIIFENADLELALKTTIRSSFLNQGEICLCGSRIFVQESIFESFTSQLAERADALTVGDPQDPETFVGALISKDHLEKVRGYIDLARELGGEIRCGGEEPANLPERCRNGYYLRPTVITGLEPDCRVLQEEIFGPVVTVNPFRDEAEVIALANGVPYGLSASVWTDDLGRAHRVARDLQVGTVWVNTWMKRDLRVPFGGVKASGLGREGGGHSIDFYTELKNICIHYDQERTHG